MLKTVWRAGSATRASLAYVPDKLAAIREFHRVLKPGGRLSIAEPICQDEAFENCSLAKLIETHPDHPDIRFLKLLYRYRAAQYPSTEREMVMSPLTNYSERDLIHLCRAAGFANIHMELHIDHTPPAVIPWEICLDISPHPWAPTLREILHDRFSDEERRILEQGLRPLIELGKSVMGESIAYLTAEKPEVG